MTRLLHCKSCGKYMGRVDKGSLRKGMITLCLTCYERLKPNPDVPDFMRGLFK